MNLYEKIVEVRKCIDGFSKDKKSFSYDYVSGNQVLGKIREKMDELKLVLSPSCHSCNHDEFHYTVTKYDKDTKQRETTEKTDFVVWGEMRYTWIDAANPDERFCEAWQYYGQQDDMSKAFGSALTYSERYYLLKFFGIPTDADDPDSKDTRGKAGKFDFDKPKKEDLKKPDAPADTPKCETCGKPFKELNFKGQTYTPSQVCESAKKKYGKGICTLCHQKELDKLNSGFDATMEKLPWEK